MEIPGYTIIRELGRGGMATVYLANQDRLNRQVALKVMTPSTTTTDDFTERFLKEGQIIAQLRHRQIVTIYDCDSYEQYHYFSMEYLAGGTLADRIQQGLEVEYALRMTRQIAEALAYAHERGIIHRDLKPQNILFHEDGTPVLTDFGIARVVNADPNATRLTRFGMTMGSPRYMSPEQIQGAPVDNRSDLYSFGIVFYEMLTGQLPYHAEDVISLAMMHCTGPVPRLPEGLSNLQPIIDRLTAKTPDERFATAAELIDALDLVDGTSPSHSTADDATRLISPQALPRAKPSIPSIPSTQAESRRPYLAIASVILLVAAAGFTGYLLLEHRSPAPDPPIGIALPPASENRPTTAANYERLAIAHFERGELDQSLKLIRLGLSMSADDPRLLMLRDQVQIHADLVRLLEQAADSAEQGRLEEGLGLVRDGLSRMPDHSGLLAMEQQLQSQLEASRLQRADQLLEQARGRQQRGDFNGVMRLVDEGLELVPDHPALSELGTAIQDRIRRDQDASDLLAKAQAGYTEGRFEEALRLIDEGLKLTPDRTDLVELRSNVVAAQTRLKQQRAAELRDHAEERLNAGALEESMDLVDEGLRLVPEDPALLALNEALHGQMEQQRAVNHYLAKARESENRGDLDGALMLAGQGLTLAPEHSGLLGLRSRVEEQQLHERQQQQTLALLAQAREEQSRGSLAEAMKLVDAGLAQSPSNTELADLKDVIQGEIDTEKETVRLYEEALKKIRQDADDEAQELVEQGLRQAPQHNGLLELKARIEERLARAQQTRAGEFLTQATERMERGDLAGSLQSIEHGLELVPEHEGLSELQTRVAAELDKRNRLAKLLEDCATRFPLETSSGLEGEAAANCYIDVLQEDPASSEALAKLTEITERYRNWIRTALGKEDLESAQALIAQLTRLDPEHSDLPELIQDLAKHDETTLSLSQPQREQIQSWLNQLDYAAGTPDGEFGSKTRHAIAAYQLDAKLPSTGYIDAALLERLHNQGQELLRQKLLPEMIAIQGGCFQMGSPTAEAGRDTDERRHEVCLEGFRLAKYEVTVEQFRRFVDATGYLTDAERNAAGDSGCWALDAADTAKPWSYHDWANWRKPNKYQDLQEDHPVTCVSWNDVGQYVSWLNGETGAKLRLPTEAEWEYAARAGTTTARFWGETNGESACAFANVADTGHEWADGFPCDDGHEWVAPVGDRRANPWGLYDVMGNVWEWTCSAYDPDYRGGETTCSGPGPIAPRVLRGGSWYSGAGPVRAAYRDRNYASARYSFLGFRLVED